MNPYATLFLVFSGYCFVSIFPGHNLTFNRHCVGCFGCAGTWYRCEADE